MGLFGNVSVYRRSVTYLAVRLDGGEIRSLSLSDEQIDGHVCAICGEHQRRLSRIGRIVKGSTVNGCDRCQRLIGGCSSRSMRGGEMPSDDN